MSRPFLIDFVGRFRFLRQVKDHRKVHVDRILIHLYILTLGSKGEEFRCEPKDGSFHRTSISRNFCRRSSDISVVNKESCTPVLSVLWIFVDELFLIDSLE